MGVRLLSAEVDALAVRVHSLTDDQYASMSAAWNAQLRRLRSAAGAPVDVVAKFDALRHAADEIANAH